MNLKNISLLVIILILGVAVISFNKDDNKIDNRWYTKEQVSLGKEVFLKNCASCHGKKAEKTTDWRKTLSDGSYPPPPLNDNAHAWHHPKWQLMQIITDGGAPYDGRMPAFKEKLTEKEKEATISYFQSFWSDEIYEIWLNSRKGLKGK